MSSDLRDQNLSMSDRLVKEFVERGFVELTQGTEVRLQMGSSISYEEYPKPIILQENYLATPLVLMYSRNGENIESLYGFHLTTEELLRIRFDSERLVPRMSFDNSRFGDRRRLTEKEENEREEIDRRLRNEFLDTHGIPRDVRGDEILEVILYLR